MISRGDECQGKKANFLNNIFASPAYPALTMVDFNSKFSAITF
jgi:hypothetical protein